MPDNAGKNRYETMQYNRCGNSGVRLPAVALGLWHNFGDVDAPDNARKMIHRAFDLGITHFDLANNYGPPPGSAEETFGRILARDMKSHRDEMIISSKAGYRMWPGPYGDGGSRKYLVASLDQSLRRMGIDYVDIFYSHRPDPQTPVAETVGALASMVRQGKALYVGISSYDPEQTMAALQVFRELQTPCLVHQPSYNMFNRWIERGLTAVLRDHGVGCVVFSPLAQGLLSDRYLKGIPTDSRAAKSWGFLRRDAITEDCLRRVRALDEMARRRGQSLAQMAIKWVLRLPEVTSVLCGASSVRQIELNAAAVQGPGFTGEELRAIDAILE